MHELDFSWSRMQIQPRYDAYRESRFFEDGSAMRTPPRGTRPFRRTAENAAVTDGTVDGHDVETIPVPVTPDLLARGRAQFEIVCAACHGAAGDGNSIPARFMERHPPSFAEERVRVLTDGRIFKIIRDGYGVMPSYATHLDVDDRWAVVAFVRALQRSRHALVARLPDDIADQLRRSAP
jgi:mono/diheme cytochrome c family protein